jgi:hypothetical protein
MALILQTDLTCPHCAHVQQEDIPQDGLTDLLPVRRLRQYRQTQIRRLLRLLLIWSGPLCLQAGAEVV